MFHACGLYVSRLRPLCFTFAVSMFHACGLYVSCLRSLSTTHGYDKGRIAFWGARKRLGALAVLCGFERRACKHRGCEAGLKHRGWVVLFGSCFSVVLLVVRSSGFVLLVVLFVVRSLGSCFGSFFSWFVLWVRAFWSFFSWFVLLFVLLVVLFVVRSFGGSYVFFVRCFKSLRGVCGKVRGFLMQR